MKILPSDKLRELDQATCERQNIDSLVLMERAATAVTSEIEERFLPSQRIVVVAGPGNNGGDALAVARQLYERGYHNLKVYLFNVGNQLSHDCDEERRALISNDAISFTEVQREFTPPTLGKSDVVVDGLFGAGCKGSLQGGFQALARLINESGAYVISIDVPSGLRGEHNLDANRRDMIHADLTLTFQLPRLSFFFEENAPVLGDIKILNINLDTQKIKETYTNYMLVEEKTIRTFLLPRMKFSGKRDYGSVLLFAGSTGMTGAAVLAARATIRSGAGLVTVHSGMQGINILQTAVPEAMFEPDRNEHFITDMTIHHEHQAVGVGPGIGTNERTINALEEMLKKATTPLVIDADALNCISKRPSLLNLLPPNTIITPHIGEFDRLFGEQKSSEARLQKAQEMAKYYNIIIVLKGHHTAIVRPVRPDGRVYFNSTGNPGMATAGAGDVLTGVISAFIAQGYRPEKAALIGVYIHGLAGDMAADELGEFGLTASDIAAYVGRAIRKVMCD
ncbi:MAG: NAD(P)H-hydrate dehydratase [Muribaculaceae bacterium]|nr:NAD(P)H-hydrate dehydratase [Muribaculaceae bacterium]